MPRRVRIFVTYSHSDARYVEGDDSLLVFLRGLERQGADFWADHKLATGELRDEEIKARVASSDIALALVSQAFLDSEYCTREEIGSFLARRLVIFPVILSPCDWQRHEWLKSRQLVPTGGETIEEHYTAEGPRKRLYLKIREDLRARIEKIRTTTGAAPNSEDLLPPNPFARVLAVRDEAAFIGRERELRRLHDMLAGGSVALWGEPKIGKSSLLFRLAATWPEEVLGPVDFEAIADRDDFYTALASELGMESGSWRKVRGELAERRALLMLDELDKATTRGVTAEDLGLLRSLCGRNSGLKVIAASRRPPKEIFPDVDGGSPVFNFLQPQHLGELAQPEAKLLLTHPWAPGAPQFDADTARDLLAAAGPHPFHLQRAAYQRYEALADPGHDWRSAWRQDLELLL